MFAVPLFPIVAFELLEAQANQIRHSVQSQAVRPGVWRFSLRSHNSYQPSSPPDSTSAR